MPTQLVRSDGDLRAFFPARRTGRNHSGNREAFYADQGYRAALQTIQSKSNASVEFSAHTCSARCRKSPHLMDEGGEQWGQIMDRRIPGAIRWINKSGALTHTYSVPGSRNFYEAVAEISTRS